MSPALLVLGGGAFAAPALRWAREAGLTTVLADPDARAPARRAASEFAPIPHDDVQAHVALARRLAKGTKLAGILAAEARALPLLAPLAEAVPGCLPARPALERALDPARARAFLLAQGLPLAEPGPSGAGLDLFAFLRDGAFVPGGIAARRVLARGDVLSVQPSGLAADDERAAYVLVERAARVLALERGPLQATLVAGAEGLALSRLRPGFSDVLGPTHVARLAYGKSPLQAWFAHLTGAGGPFDELALVPRACAGWLSIASERAGRFAGADGLTRARAMPGIADVWIEEPGRELDAHERRPIGYLWAEGKDRGELEERLGAARAALEVRIACRQQVA